MNNNELRCPFCNDPILRYTSQGVTFRCGTYGPDEKGEYRTGHTCDITTWTYLIERLQNERNELIETLKESFERMELYEMDVDTSPPRDHRQFMERVEVLLEKHGEL